MKFSMALPRTPRSEDGFALIEVIVSAAVLALVALAVLSGVDAAAGSSAREKARAVAANLAEQDQERLRSLSVDTLKAVPQVPAISVDGAVYKIKSEAVWITDDKGGTPACGNSTNRSEYLHITTTVTSTIVGSSRVPPVKIDSLYSPNVGYSQTHGTLGVKVLNRNDAPVVGLAVTVDNGLGTQNTDQNGCVWWRSVPVKSYTATIDR